MEDKDDPTKRPTGPFWDASHNTKPVKGKLQSLEELNPLRDKGNDAPRIKPSFAQQPPPNLAPSGSVGMKRDMPVPGHQKAKRFDIKRPDALKNEFKRLVVPSKDRSRDIDR
jgi:hypothetical protein